MAKRINITLPDDLYNRLQEVKSGMNISRICQEAIMNQVVANEVARDGSVQDFMTASKEKYYSGYVKAGERLATEALERKHLPYNVIITLSEIPDEVENMYDALHLALRDIEEDDLFSNYIEDYEYDHNQDKEVACEYLAAGFVQGVKVIKGSL